MFECICMGCKKRPNDISEYKFGAKRYGISAEEFVRREEGTYNQNNGHFLCTDCYVDSDMPATEPGEAGWICP